MAIYPCDYSKHRYPEPQQSIYVVRPVGTKVVGGTLRLCPKHFRMTIETAQEVMNEINEDVEIGSVCESCGADEHMVVFARCFPTRAEEIQLAADLCNSCYNSLVDNLKLAHGRPLRER